MDHSQVIIRPVVSEKSYVLSAADRYTFRVHADAHKTQIRQAVDWYRTHGFRSVDDVRHAGKRYRSLMLSKPIAQVAPLAELWWAPHRTFVDPDSSNQVGLIIEGPSLQALHEALQAEGAADAMKFDRVRPDTIRILVEG